MDRRNHHLVAAVCVSVVVATGCGSQRQTSLGGAATPPPSARPITTAPAGSTIAPSPTRNTTASRPGTAATTATTARTIRSISPAGESPVRLTPADSGTATAVLVGASVELTLDGSGTNWGAVSVTPDGLLAPGPAPPRPPHGTAARWTAARAGSVRVTATGGAWCPPSPQPIACPMWAREFSVTLVVS